MLFVVVLQHVSSRRFALGYDWYTVQDHPLGLCCICEGGPWTGVVAVQFAIARDFSNILEIGMRGKSRLNKS